jgi:molybdopterin converting factor small subunit
MSTSPTRRYKRQQDRQAKKLFSKVRQETLDQINKHTPEERDNLLKLYQVMLEQREQERINRQNTVIIEEENTELDGL